MTSSAELVLIEDGAQHAILPPWKLLVVDDDEEMHAVTRLALRGFEFDGRPVQLIAAKSAAQAREQLAAHEDIALVLLDVVMETEHAGLDLVRYLREVLHNNMVRIVLRTGQPGQAPPNEVVSRYQIDDYRTKNELTYQRLYVLVMTSLRTYKLLIDMEQQREELTRSNHDLESFAFAASHDLQTPVRSLVSFAQLLKRRYSGELGVEGNELLDFIATGARGMQALIVDLVEYSRVGLSSPKFEAVELTPVVQSAWQTLSPAVHEHKAQLDCGPLPVVQANAVLLRQLFRNLLDNAIKYQPDRCPSITIRAREVDGQHEIRVSDNGIGIEPQYLEQIFQPFRRLHTKDQFPGTGLGLALCRKVALMHRGTLRAESIPGAGSTFILTLPGKPRAA